MAQRERWDRGGHPEEGQADVPLIALAAPAGAGDGASSEPFEVIRAGKYMREGREIEISDGDLDRMVANFERWRELGAEVPVDYDHSFHEGGESRAAGWFTELVRRGRSLFARVRWTPEAARQIAEREYRFFSPEWTKNWISEGGEAEGPTMIAGGLTNRPFLRGMTPVALSREAGAAAYEALAGSVAERLAAGDRGEVGSRDETPPGVPQDADKNGNGDAAATAEGKAPESAAPAGGEGGEGKAPEPEPGTEAASRRSEETVTMTRSEERELRAKAAKADELDGKVEALTGRIDTVTEELDAERFTADFDRAKREGRVDAKPETRERWSKRYEDFGRVAAKELLFDMPATIPVDERGSGGEAGDAGAAPEGTDQDAHQLNARVEAYQAEHPDSTYEQALAAVEKADTRPKAAA